MRMQVFVLLLISSALAQDQPEYIKRILGAKNLQIGFDKDCHLFWLGQSGDVKPGEFRCGTNKGDPMELTSAGDDKYKFASDGRHMYWLGKKGDVKPMEFRPGPGDTFWIKDQGKGMYAIGFDDCPLYWLGKEGNTKPAEFRCGEPIKDTFWIKGANCTAKIVEPIADDENQATYDGEEIIGVAASGTCSKTSSQVLTLGRTDEVTEEIGIGFENTTEDSYEFGASISVTGKVGLFGTGVDTTATASVALGSSVGFSSTESKSTGMTTSNSAGSETHYNTPGAAIVVGFTKRYVFDKSNVPAKVTIECANGYQYEHDTTIKLRSKVFGSTFFSTDAVEFKEGKCDENYLECMHAKNYRSFKSVVNAKQAFKDCFPTDVLKEKKRAKKARSKTEKIQTQLQTLKNLNTNYTVRQRAHSNI